MVMTENLLLVSIELNNFKSFKGLHRVSPLTDFTSVVGPNGSGKSNIIDAVAFALCLPLLPAKHAHTRELVYRANQQVNSPPSDMHVQLNFNSCSFRRSYTDGVHEYTFLADGKHERPMTANEYRDKVVQMNLDIGEFCHYQDRLLNQFNKSRRESLTQTFETLSGSSQFKEEYELLKGKITVEEQQLREVSDKLKDKRHEKIKMRGLADYQKEIDKCISEQGKYSKLLSAVQLLSLHQKIQTTDVEVQKLTSLSDQNYTLRTQCLQEVKRQEASLRVLDNKIQQNRVNSKQLRSDLMELQTNSYQSEKTSESAKLILMQKKQLYQQHTFDLGVLESKRNVNETKIEEAVKKLAMLEKRIQESPELASEQAIRDQYLDIKAKLQSENAQIERETCKVENKMQILIQKQAFALNNLKTTESRLGADELSMNSQLQNGIKQATSQLETKQEQINGVRRDLTSLQKESSERKNKLQVVEKQLLESEFELSELESEKNLKSHDVRLQQILSELRQRCRGYKGRFYELVKPINASFDIAVKVSLSKCLKMLVVDDTDSAQICSDFLKEKSISLDVLVLSNVPDRQFSNGVGNKIQAFKGASLIYDIIEVPRSEQALERAVRYFAGDKVFVKEFKQASELQKKGVKDIITEDGTHFQQGMISGGQHQNIFKLQFGTNQLDKHIITLVDKISKLEAQHFELKQSLKDEFMQKETVLLRDLQGCELEIEQLRTKKQVLEKQLQQASQSSQGLNLQIKEQKKEFETLAEEIKQLRQTKQELSSDIRQIETKYFAEFCKAANVKSVLEYENRLFGREQENGDSHVSLLQERAELEHSIARLRTDLTFAKQQETQLVKSIEGLKQSINDEEQKLRSVASVQAQQTQIQKMQDLLRETEEGLQLQQKERSNLHAKQVKQRQELETLTMRDEVILKDKNTFKIQFRREENILKEMIEQVKMNRSFEGAHDTNDDLINTAIKFLDSVGGQELKENFTQSEIDLKQKVKDLEKMEEQFNTHVAVIPETDQAALQLSSDIQMLKDNLERMSNSIGKLKNELVDVKKSRSDKFLDYFNKVSMEMPLIYRELTGQIGTSSLLITDSVDLPFESQILFDFCPPNKRHGSDIDQLSGGEKSMAALSFILALAKISCPPLVILDEVDAFLDSENVDFIANYLTRQRKSQILIVSHKEELASRGKSLIGVCANRTELTSQSFSMDLQQFDK